VNWIIGEKAVIKGIFMYVKWFISLEQAELQHAIGAGAKALAQSTLVTAVR
jgi:hypothetical protein